jgi:ADP-ribosylglycohydrolase
MKELTVRDRCRGVILGTAVGDSIDLPAEGISRQRAKKLFPGRWRHRLVINRGMVSDDTDHAAFVAQSLLVYPHSSGLFAKRLSWCLRWWLLSLPASVGFATLRSILRLWLGVSRAHSGVYSAGNGAAMRSAPIGAFFANWPDQIDEYVEASTRLTHADPRALTGAKAVAYLAAWSIRDRLVERPELDGLLKLLHRAGNSNEEWTTMVRSMATAYQQRLSVE